MCWLVPHVINEQLFTLAYIASTTRSAPEKVNHEITFVYH